MISRRSFFAGSAALTAIPAALAQEAQPRRIALVDLDEPVQRMTEESGHPGWGAFLKELRRLGHAEGESIIIDRWSGGPVATMGMLRRQPEVIAATFGAAWDIWDAVGATPIVVTGSFEGDFDDDFFVEFGRANITGISQKKEVLLDRAAELPKMQLQLLRQAAPGATRIAWLATFTYFDDCSGDCRFVEFATQKLDLPLHRVQVMNSFDAYEPFLHPPSYWEAEYQNAFAEIARARCGAFIVGSGSLPVRYAELVGRLSIAGRLPGIAQQPELVNAGLLMCCRPNRADLFRRSAIYVDRVLKGAKPAAISIEEPTKFDLIINMKTAEAIGMALPQSLLALASELIE